MLIVKIKKSQLISAEEILQTEELFSFETTWNLYKMLMSSSELINRICGQLVKLQFKCWEMKAFYSSECGSCVTEIGFIKYICNSKNLPTDIKDWCACATFQEIFSSINF